MGREHPASAMAAEPKAGVTVSTALCTAECPGRLSRAELVSVQYDVQNQPSAFQTVIPEAKAVQAKASDKSLSRAVSGAQSSHSR